MHLQPDTLASIAGPCLSTGDHAFHTFREHKKILKVDKETNGKSEQVESQKRRKVTFISAMRQMKVFEM